MQRVANEYIRPDEAAVVVVGDGAEIKQQVKPFAETAETYNTSGELVG